MAACRRRRAIVLKVAAGDAVSPLDGAGTARSHARTSGAIADFRDLIMAGKNRRADEFDGQVRATKPRSATIPAVQLLRDQKAFPHVVNAERERVDATVCFPFRQAAIEVCF
jgi:hypothetical protein